MSTDDRRRIERLAQGLLLLLIGWWCGQAAAHRILSDINRTGHGFSLYCDHDHLTFYDITAEEVLGMARVDHCDRLFHHARP